MSEHGACFVFLHFKRSTGLYGENSVASSFFFFFLKEKINQQYICVNTPVCFGLWLLQWLTWGSRLSWTLEVGTMFKDLLYTQLNLWYHSLHFALHLVDFTLFKFSVQSTPGLCQSLHTLLSPITNLLRNYLIGSNIGLSLRHNTLPRSLLHQLMIRSRIWSKRISSYLIFVLIIHHMLRINRSINPTGNKRTQVKAQESVSA